jgi:hypothetical protein
MVKALLLAALLHPLHTSLAKLTIEKNSVTVSLRLFADDITAVAGNDAFTYAAATLIIRNPKGQSIRLASCGSQKVGDLVWLCLRGTGTAATVESKVFFERYQDQINIVQTVTAGHAHNLLFTSGDPPKRID